MILSVLLLLFKINEMRYLYCLLCGMFLAMGYAWARPSDTIVRVDRPLPAFSQIVIQDGVEVFFTTGSFGCVIECRPGNDSFLVTEVEKSVLTLRITAPKIGTRVYLSAPQLERVEIATIGSFTALNPLQAGHLELLLKGAARMETRGVRASTLSVKQYGTAMFKDMGNIAAHQVEALMYGVGSMQMDSLRAKSVMLHIKGSGAIKVIGCVNAPLLEVLVNGLGSLQCRGVDAQQTNAELKGAGLIRLEGKTVHLQSNVVGLGKLDTEKLRRD